MTVKFSQAGKAFLNRYQGTWPRYVSFEEKHGNRVFLANSSEDLRDIFTTIFKERWKEEFYEGGDDEVDDIMHKNDFFGMIGWIVDNRTNEYESFEIENFSTPIKWVDNPT